ncbi:MAG: protein kinase [Deltaproteobacteria bacterium]|nr:protein kinase [Deltaproteobacteria bacterium]
MTNFSDPRFEVISELGRGTDTCVYLVRDRVHEVVRALKLATERGRLRDFRREYFRLCELRHPNIVSAYDFGITVDGQPYYTMDYVAGTHLGELVGRASPDLLAAIALQALEAVSVLHARGLVHRDLKPKNLLILGVSPTPLVRLIDLGLAIKVGSRTLAAGTLPYIAPEVARGDAIDGRADLYSLGALLYELLLPEESARTLHDVAKRLTVLPTAPNRINPLIPESFSAFIIKLLNPDPKMRYSDAEEAARALARIADIELRRGPPRSITERMMRVGAASHRHNIRQRLRRAALAARRKSRGSLWCLEAPVGVGKSPLLRELSMLFNLIGLRVFKWSVTNEAQSPIKQMMHAVHVLCPEYPHPPELNLVTNNTDLTIERSEVLAEVSSRIGIFLAKALGQSPTAILLDDLQKADPVVIEVLLAFGRASHKLPLLVIAACEPSETVPSSTTLFGSNANLIRLRQLSTIEVARLTAHRLHGLQLPAPALDRLVRDSQGMPSLVEKTLARMIVDRTIQLRGNRWVFVGGRYRPVRHADYNFVLQRTGELSTIARNVLWAAAVLNTNLDANRIATITNLQYELVNSTLAKLAGTELLDFSGTTAESNYKFSSRTTQTLIYQNIPLSHRRQLHDNAAELFAAIRVGTIRSEEEIEHILRGSNDARAIAIAKETAEQAASLCADRRAISYYLRAYTCISDKTENQATQIALRLGKLYERTGELEHASSWFNEAMETNDCNENSQLTILAALGLGGVKLLKGMVKEAQTLVEKAKLFLEAEAQIEPILLAATDRLTARIAAARGDSRHGEKVLCGALELLDGKDNEAAAIEVLLELARLTQGRGELISAVRYARRALQRARRLGDSVSIADASVVLGRGLIRSGRFETARHVLMRGRRNARISKDKLREAQLYRQLGNIQIRQGFLDRAIEHYTYSLELARSLGARAEQIAGLRDIGSVRARLGEFKPAFIALHAAVDVANEVGDSRGSAYSALELVYSYTEVGNYQAAQAFLNHTQSISRSLEDRLLNAEINAINAWLALCCGNREPAQNITSLILELVKAIEDPGQRVRPLVYAGRSCLSIAATRFATMITDRLTQEIEESKRRDYSAWLQGLRGLTTLEQGERSRAHTQLCAAIALAARSGLKPLEIELRAALANIHQGVQRGAQEATRAMEILRDVTIVMPPELIEPYLARSEAIDLRATFNKEYTRLFGNNDAR